MHHSAAIAEDKNAYEYLSAVLGAPVLRLGIPIIGPENSEN